MLVSLEIMLNGNSESQTIFMTIAVILFLVWNSKSYLNITKVLFTKKNAI